MALTCRKGPPNGLIFISDLSDPPGPPFAPNVAIFATAQSIAVMCMIWVDGETEIVLGSASDVGKAAAPDFDHALETPNLGVLVSTVDGERLLETSVAGRATRVRIWLNRPWQPDEVIIGLG